MSSPQSSPQSFPQSCPPARARSARRVLVRSGLALLAPVSLLAAPAAGSATDAATDSAMESATESIEAPAPAASVSVLRAGDQRVRLTALPRIVQHGGQVADPDEARAALVATIRPVRVGRTVELQVQRGESWAVVDTARQNKQGRAQLAWASAEDGQPLTYRVKAHRSRVAGSPTLPALTSEPVSTARWQHATWTDQFSGSELGPAWVHRGGGYEPGSRRTCSRTDPRAVSVGGGAVRISVIKDPDRAKRCRVVGRDATTGRYAYRLHGHIGTQNAFSFRYGVAAARIKFHRRRGQHAAFWMQPTDGPHPDGSEIDIVEYFGDRHPQGGIATFVHRYNLGRNNTSGGWIPRSTSYLASRRDGWSKNYHVFSVEWTPRMLIFRIDGKETSRMRGRISEVRQFPILSLLASDYEIPKIRDRHLPQHMYVDWLRVWETPR